jgi:hypothetical protein
MQSRIEQIQQDFNNDEQMMETPGGEQDLDVKKKAPKRA